MNALWFLKWKPGRFTEWIRERLVALGNRFGFHVQPNTIKPVIEHTFLQHDTTCSKHFLRSEIMYCTAQYRAYAAN
jgi:hypothetical protein